MMILSFMILGAVFSFVFSVVTDVEKIIGSRVVTFVFDVLMFLSFSVVFFCFVLGFGTSGFRYYHLLFTVLGFALYRLTVHRLFAKVNCKAVNFLILKRKSFTKRLKKF